MATKPPTRKGISISLHIITIIYIYHHHYIPYFNIVPSLRSDVGIERATDPHWLQEIHFRWRSWAKRDPLSNRSSKRHCPMNCDVAILNQPIVIYIYMCMYMYVCMYIYRYIYIYVYIYINVYKSIYIHMYLYIYMYLYIHVCTCKCTCIYIYICQYICTCKCTCIYIHIYIYVNIHM